MSEFIKILLVILLSSVKFVAGPFFAYSDKRYDFSFFETVLYCVIGGMLGVFIFTYFSKQLFRFWHYVKLRFRKAFKKKEIFSEPVADVNVDLEIHYEYVESNSSKKIFTPHNRRIVKVWRKYGLFGIALLTPVILSIPIGTIVANSFVSNRKKIIIYMFFSVLFWSITMTTLFELFHEVTVNELKEHLYK
ncbi:MAG: hypothetical protein ABI772_09385 [Bacteroidota bacterium]